MKCISPMSVAKPRKGQERDHKNRLTVPCGNCYACLSNKRADWSFRLSQEHLSSHNAYFITLTYDEDHLVLNHQYQPTLVKRDVQLFLKRLRKKVDTGKYNVTPMEKQWLKTSKIRYYVTGEYGEKTNRPHYHMLLFNVPRQVVEQLPQVWGLGNIQIGDVTPASIHYVAKYVINRYDQSWQVVPPFAMMSQGIGKQYVKRTASYHKKKIPVPFLISDSGHKQRIPRYIKEKIFSDAEKEKVNEITQQMLEEKEQKGLDKLGYQYFEDRLEYSKQKQRQFKLNNSKKGNNEI